MRPIVENHYAWDASAQRDRVLRHLNSARIIKIEGQDVGLLKAVTQDGEVHLSQVQLLAAYQGRGIATHLIRKLQQEAASKGRPVTLHVLKSNRAVNLYLRLGFLKTQEDKHSYTMVWRPASSQPPASVQS
jgi:ribosomal protein S18 acetylase RimI-like enzyme